MSDKSLGSFQIFAIVFFLIFLVGVLGSMFFFAWKIFAVSGQASGKPEADSLKNVSAKFMRIERDYTDDDFIYRLHIDSISRSNYNSEDSVFRIEILSKISKRKIQEINPGKNELISSGDQSVYPRFVIRDLNADGTNDFRLMTAIDEHKKQHFAKWFYDPASKNFTADSLNQKPE